MGHSSSRGRLDHASSQSANTAIESFARATEHGIEHQTQNGSKVAEASNGRRYEDRTDETRSARCQD